VLRFGRIALVIRMTADDTTCLIRRESEKDDVSVPTEVMKESDEANGPFRQLEEYFYQGKEAELIGKIQGIQRSIRADAVIVEMAAQYHPADGDKGQSCLSNNTVFARLNCSVQHIPWTQQQLEVERAKSGGQATM
jgi:hypothetical protein